MRRFLWLGLLFLSTSWLFFIPEFNPPDGMKGLLFLLLGIICMGGGMLRGASSIVDKRYMLLVIPLALAILVIPYPYNLGIAVLIIGLLLIPITNTSKKLGAIPQGIILSGVILMIQAEIFPLYAVFTSHGHRVDLLSPLMSFLGSFFGLHTSTNNGILFIQTIQQTYPITITWEKLGLFLWLTMFLGAVLLFVLLYEKRRIVQVTLIFLVTSGVYLVLRFLAVLYGYINTMELSIFWDPVIMMLSFLPFALLLMKLISFRDRADTVIEIPSFVVSRRHAATLLMVFLLVFSTVGMFVFQDPGMIKNGRVLIDEYHSQWEDTTRALDTEWYGLLSTYNYYSWAQWLDSYYDVDKNTESALSTELLSHYDILILKCPTESYTHEEIQDIRRFVDAGGGLYLIGDHTNVFGMNTFLNQISEQFGIRFRTDATYELGTGNLSIYRPERMLSHPIMRHVTQFDFMTSCTLEPTSLYASLTMENIIIGNMVTSEPGTYATENFFRESVSSPDSEYGYLLQTAAIKFGQGRVVAFTDSTVFSSFSMFTDGYPAFTLGVLEYLNRSNTSGYLNIVFLCIAVLSLILLLVLLRNIKKFQAVWMMLFAGALACISAVLIFSSLINISYPLPMMHADTTQVCFEQQHSSFSISVKPTATLSNNQRNYGTFFVWTQRVGCIPSIENTLQEAVGKADIIVFINPTQPFSDEEIQLLTTFLEQNGRILVMDSITNPDSTANELIGNFGIWVTTNTDFEALYETVDGNLTNSSRGNITSPYLSLTGGQQILLTSHNNTQVCVAEVTNKTTGANGRLVVVVDSYAFSDTVMGGTFTEPSEQQRRIYETEFYLFESLLLQ
jgi:hypothetical protein